MQFNSTKMKVKKEQILEEQKIEKEQKRGKGLVETAQRRKGMKQKGDGRVRYCKTAARSSKPST